MIIVTVGHFPKSSPTNAYPGHDIRFDPHLLVDVVGPDHVSGGNFLYDLRRAIRKKHLRSSGMAGPGAPARRYGEYLRPRPVVNHGLLLYRVNVLRHDLAVDEKVQLAADDPSYSAEAHLALADLAVPGASGALDPSGREVPVELGLLP